MIRWNYIIPRAALFVLFVGLSTLAMNPMVRWGVVRTAESITGGKVEVAKVRCALAKGHVTLDGVRAADPQHPMKNLFVASRVHLDVDTTALKQRRFAVTQGRATGFQFGTQRTPPGLLDASSTAKYASRLAEQFATSGQAWMRNAVGSLTADVSSSLQSLAMSRQLAEGWPQEQERIDARSTYIQDRIAEIQELIDSSGENPLRNILPYQQAIAELETLQKEAYEITGGMNRLRQQLLMDKNAIEEARKSDEAYVAKSVQLGSLDEEHVSEFLVGPELNAQIAQILGWVQWGRKQIPTGSGISLTRHGRGEDLFFPGIEPQPKTEIGELAIEGSVDFAGNQIPIEGTIRGLSSHPKVAAAPVEVNIQTIEGGQLSIQALLNNSGDQSHDHVLVNCPNLPTSQRTLGDIEKLAVTVSPGVTQMWIRMEVVGDDVTGEVIVKQKNIQLTPQLDPMFAGGEASQLVATSLDGIDRIETRAQLSGTIDQPVCQIESSLGPDVATGIAQVMDNAVRQQRLSVLASTYAEVDAMIARLDLAYQQKNEALVAQFEAGRDQIEQIREIIATRVDANDGVLNEDWPLRESFRR